MCRAHTKKEVCVEFLDQIKTYVRFWLKTPDRTEKEKLEGLVFSILTIFDGVSSMPAIDLIVRPHPDDKNFYIGNGDNWYEDGMVINDNISLHDLF